MKCTGKKFGLLKGRKTVSLKFGLLDKFFCHFHQWGLHLFLRRKYENYRTCNASQSQDGGLTQEYLFAVRPETWLHLTQLIWSHFAQNYGKNVPKFILVQRGPNITFMARRFLQGSMVQDYRYAKYNRSEY